jgi:hypothetical protein
VFPRPREARGRLMPRARQRFQCRTRHRLSAISIANNHRPRHDAANCWPVSGF